MKRILLITQWFDPEPTFKGILFAKKLISKGYHVEVITGFPNYPSGKIYSGYRLQLFKKEIIDGVCVNRVYLYPSHNRSKLGRILNYLSFFISSLIFGILMKNKPDIIYAYHPPITTAISGVLLKMFRKIPLVVDIQDLWPDTLKATNMITSKFLLSVIAKLCNFVYERSDCIVVQSPGFKEEIQKRIKNKNKVKLIYNWTDETKLRIKNDEEFNSFCSDKKFKLLYAGNIGFAQKLDILINAAIKLKKENDQFEIEILGNGPDFYRLKKNINDLKLDNISLLGYVEMDKVSEYIINADALFIHLKKDPLFEITIPGKTQAYMFMGKPIIIGVKGNASDLITRANCGINIDPENSDSLIMAMKKLNLLSKSELNKIGDNGRNFYSKNLSIDVGVDLFITIFDNLIKNKVLI